MLSSKSRNPLQLARPLLSLLEGGEADDAAGKAGTSVAGGGGELVATLSKIILKLVHNEGAADDGVGAVEGDLRVGEGELGDTVGVRSDVAEVAGVALLIFGGAVSLARGVKVGAGGHAAVGGVAELVEVEAVEAGGEALDLAGDGGRAGVLGEGDDAGHASGTGHHADGLLLRREDGEGGAGGGAGARGADRHAGAGEGGGSEGA
mmetsp:Transcript_49992/g.159993  ORF Transcript_49992/g.159993 Transcript_49992/m.159993 type:complete len:206 (+) Transcript_49992:220-837(+)